MHQPILLGLLALTGSALAQGDFTLSCIDIALAGSLGSNQADILVGTCHTHSVTTPYRNTTLDLDQCLGIDQITGALVWSFQGKYSDYCHSCSVKPVNSTTELQCLCQPLTGRFLADTCINLDQEVSNNGGTLACPNATGT